MIRVNDEIELGGVKYIVVLIGEGYIWLRRV